MQNTASSLIIFLIKIVKNILSKKNRSVLTMAGLAECRFTGKKQSIRNKNTAAVTTWVRQKEQGVSIFGLIIGTLTQKQASHTKSESVATVKALSGNNFESSPYGS